MFLWAIFAIAIWFLPVKDGNIKASFSTKDAKRSTATAPKEPGTIESYTWSVRIGSGSPAEIAARADEAIRPGFEWSFRVIAFICTMYQLLGLWIVYRLFHFYEQAMIFAAETVQCLKWIGLWFLGYWAQANFIEVTDFWTQNPAFIDLRIDEYFAAGFLVLLISWIMEEGCKLKEEQQLTI